MKVVELLPLKVPRMPKEIEQSPMDPITVQ
jgi:hypothetical protein